MPFLTIQTYLCWQGDPFEFDPCISVDLVLVNLRRVDVRRLPDPPSEHENVLSVQGPLGANSEVMVVEGKLCLGLPGQGREGKVQHKGMS